MLDYRIGQKGKSGKGQPLEYRIPQPRRGRQFDPNLIQIEQAVSAEEPIGLIYGRKPQSKEEWWIAKALWALGHSFRYQVPVFGGYWIRGGQILDFVVDTTAPLPTIIEFNGDYWHQGLASSEESFNEVKLRAEYQGQMNLLVLWSDDAQSPDHVHSLLRSRLR